MIDDNNICYLCGKELEGEISRDHVPPKQFYAKSLRKRNDLNLFSLPTHFACNKAYQNDEDYFIHAIAPLTMESHSGNALWEDMAHQYTRPQGTILGTMILKEFANKLPSRAAAPWKDGKTKIRS